jgi:hypothetical protein
MAIEVHAAKGTAASEWLSPAYLPTLAPLLRLIAGIWAIPLVQRIGVAYAGGQADLWVLMREEARDDEDRIALLEREYRQAESAPVELHVAPLSEIDAELLPSMDLILER